MHFPFNVQRHHRQQRRQQRGPTVDTALSTEHSAGCSEHRTPCLRFETENIQSPGISPQQASLLPPWQRLRLQRRSTMSATERRVQSPVPTVPSIECSACSSTRPTRPVALQGLTEGICAGGLLVLPQWLDSQWTTTPGPKFCSNIGILGTALSTLKPLL